MRIFSLFLILDVTKIYVLNPYYQQKIKNQ